MSKLACRIEGRNRVSAEATRLQTIALEDFRPLIGKKIVNDDGSLSLRYKHLMPVAGPGIEMVWQRKDKFALCFTVRTIANTAGHQAHTFYAEQSFTVGNLRDGVLVDVLPFPSEFRADYTEAEILRLRQELAAARDAMRKAEGALYLFGEYDS